MRSKVKTYVVWRRSDGYIDASAGYLPLGDRLMQFEEIFRSEDWPACRSRIRAERTAVVMNEDLWPIPETAEGNRRVACIAP
jgi:hypothetical protein